MQKEPGGFLIDTHDLHNDLMWPGFLQKSQMGLPSGVFSGVDFPY